MEFEFVVETRAFEKSLDEMLRTWQIRTTDTLDEWGKELVNRAEDLSPQDKLRGVDPRRRPSSERLALMWRRNLGRAGRDFVLNVGNVDPKMPFILFDTSDAGTITSKGPWPLKWYLPDGTVLKKDTVQHRGHKGQPVHEWALQAFDIDGKVRQLANLLVL